MAHQRFPGCLSAPLRPYSVRFLSPFRWSPKGRSAGLPAGSVTWQSTATARPPCVRKTCSSSTGIRVDRISGSVLTARVRMEKNSAVIYSAMVSLIIWLFRLSIFWGLKRNRLSLLCLVCRTEDCIEGHTCRMRSCSTTGRPSPRPLFHSLVLK